MFKALIVALALFAVIAAASAQYYGYSSYGYPSSYGYGSYGYGGYGYPSSYGYSNYGLGYGRGYGYAGYYGAK